MTLLYSPKFKMVLAIVVALGAMSCHVLFADDAVWRAVPHTGVAATDVNNEGFPLYAYMSYSSAGTTITVNGVRFKRFNSYANYARDISFSVNFSGKVDAKFYDVGDVEEPYLHLLDSACYGSESTMTMTFKNLTIGKRYRAQLFFTDHRNPARWVQIGDQRVNYGGDGFEKGGRLVGEFTATDYTHSVEQEYSSGARQLNAVCLRQISQDMNDVQWTVNETTGNETDVDTRGDLVYAVAATDSQPTLNGVQFGKVKSDTDWDNVELSFANATTVNRGSYGVDSVLNNMPSANYRTLLKAVAYFSDAGAAALTLKNLTPGRRYLVQLWVSDSRDNSMGYSQALDNMVTLKQHESTPGLPYGDNAVGIFTATSTNQVLTLREISARMALNAIQVREIASVSRGDTWTSQAITGVEENDIRKEGDTVFAYMFCHKPGPITMNDVYFPHLGTPNPSDDLRGYVSYAPGFPSFYTGYCPESVELSSNYHELLGCGGYGSSQTVDFTFNNLQPGFRYLAQYFFADLRNQNGTMYASIGEARAYYNGSSFPKGGMLIGEMTAASTSKTARVTYSSINAQQLNALQLRCLGFDGLTRAANAGDEWNTSGTGWTTGGTSLAGQTVWDETNGPTNSAGFFTANATLTLASDVWVDTISSTGPLTLNGAERKLHVGHQIFATQAVVNAQWGSRWLVKSREGRLTLAGGCPALTGALITDGAVAFACDPERQVALGVYAPGALEVAEGHVVKAASLAGTGTLRGSGRVDVVSGEALVVPTGIVRDGITWGLFNGSTLEFANGADLSDDNVYVDDPETAMKTGRVVVRASGAHTGNPKFIFPGTVKWRAEWNSTESGYQILGPSGMSIIFR